MKKLKQIIREEIRILKELKEQYDPSFVPYVGSIDTWNLKNMYIKNRTADGILTNAEKEFMKKPDVVVITANRFNTIWTDGKQEFEINIKTNKLVKPLRKARKEIVNHFKNLKYRWQGDTLIFEAKWSDFKHTKGLRKLVREEIQSLNEANEGDRFVHKYSPEIEIELIEPTNRGWKVKQTTGRKSKTAFFDKGDIMGAKAIFKPIKESLMEGKEPQIITQLRDVMENGYQTLKDPKTGKRMKVDTYSASAIVKVYDAIKNPTTKEKFANQGLLRMQSLALKFVK